jgi:putative oxidoreductase
MQITANIVDAWAPNVVALSTGLLVARLVFGVMMSAHGAQKLFGWFGGYGVTATGEFFVQLGFRPARLFATVASLTEVVAGILVAVGFLGPVGPALMHWKNGLFAGSNGIELTLLYAAAGAGLALTGPGLFSLDALLGLQALWSPALAGVALAIGIVGGIGNLAARRPLAALSS